MVNTLDETPKSASASTAPVEATPSPTPSVTPEENSPTGNKKLLMLIVMLVLLVGAGAGLLYVYQKPQAKDATAYNTPKKVAAPTATPTPTPEINPSDASNAALDSDQATLEKNITNAGADLDAANASFNDQQTNLE